jgi:hypothetical protein
MVNIMKRYFDGNLEIWLASNFQNKGGLIAENFIPSLVDESRRYQFSIGVVNITHKNVPLYTENFS